MVKKRQTHKVGSIVAIPLPNGQYAYAKIFNDEEFAIYNLLTFKISAVEHVKNAQIAFYQAATDSAIKNGEWPVIGEDPFPDGDSAWPPPKAYGVVVEAGIGLDSPKIIEKGQIRSATLEEIKGMEIDTFCQRPELLIDKIMMRLVEGKPPKNIVPVNL